MEKAKLSNKAVKAELKNKAIQPKKKCNYEISGEEFATKEEVAKALGIHIDIVDAKIKNGQVKKCK